MSIEEKKSKILKDRMAQRFAKSSGSIKKPTEEEIERDQLILSEMETSIHRLFQRLQEYYFQYKKQLYVPRLFYPKSMKTSLFLSKNVSIGNAIYFGFDGCVYRPESGEALDLNEDGAWGEGDVSYRLVQVPEDISAFRVHRDVVTSRPSANGRPGAANDICWYEGRCINIVDEKGAIEFIEDRIAERLADLDCHSQRHVAIRVLDFFR